MHHSPRNHTRTAHRIATLAFLLACACSDGIGHPLLAAPAADETGDGGSPAMPNPEPEPTPSPSAATCEEVNDWPQELESSEQQMMIALRSLRASAPRCGGTGFQSTPLPDLAESDELRCSARLHSLDMTTRQFFAEVTPDGVGPAERMASAGFEASAWAEIVAMGDEPVEIVQDLFWAGGEDCEAMVSPDFDEFGVGRRGQFWTIDLGRR
jgi:uncharacterized protein YkwD